MPDSLELRVGESRQLRPPADGVSRWISSAPEVASTTDEDVVAGRPGGLIAARRAGLARITAFALDGETAVLELDVRVEAGAELPVVRIERSSGAPLPILPGVTRWTVAHPKVADVADGRVHGLAPGITIARADDGRTVIAIEVSGSMDAETGQSVRLDEYFGAPVTGWRTSCPSEVIVDATGTVLTGDRPRTVEVTAELATGRTFTFNMRIAASSTARQEARAPAAIRPSPLPASSGQVPPTIAPVPDTSRTAESLLRDAEAHMAADRWTEAGVSLTAARLATVADPAMALRVEQLHARLLADLGHRAAATIVRALEAVAAGDFDRGGRPPQLRLPREWQSVSLAIQQLAVKATRFATNGDDANRDAVDEQLAGIWNELVRLRLTAALPLLADLGITYGERIVPLMLDVLADPSTGLPVDVRDRLQTSLNIAGSVAIEAVLGKLAAGETAPQIAAATVGLLPDLPLSQNGACIVRTFRTVSAADRARLAKRISSLLTNTPGALFDLLAAVLNRMPPDPAFATAIQAEIRHQPGAKSDELESRALFWAARGHRSAQTVLRRLYGYDAGAFPQ